MNFSSIPNSLIKFLFISLFFLLTFNFAFAQGATGVGIKPAIIEDKLDPNTVKIYSVEIRNLSSVDQTFYLSKRDIINVEDGGVPIFSDSNSRNTGYELSDWITLEKDLLMVPAGMSQNVTFTLRVPENATPGGHFGGIIVSAPPSEMKTSGASIGYKIANIISIRISGDVLESAKIKQFSTENYINSKIDIDFLVKLENEGNTLIKPTGLLEVYNMLGKKVAAMKFNENLSGVFPKTTENFVVDWGSDRSGFGRYEAVLSLTYGDKGEMHTISNTVNFWVLPINIIILAIGLLTVLFFMIYFGIGAYIKRTDAIMASGSNRWLIRSRRQNEFPIWLVLSIMLIIAILLGVILILLFS